MPHRIAFAVISLFAFSLTACGKSADDKSANDSKAKTADKKLTQKTATDGKKATTPVRLEKNKMTEIQEISYILGTQLGRSIKLSRQNDPDLKALDIEILLQGIRDAANDKKLLFTPMEMQQVMMAYQMKKAKKLLEASKKFMQSKKQEKGVVAHKSGLLYKVLKKGTGKSPTVNDIVQVHYSAQKPDGKEFDSSYRAGRPISFRLNQMIQGWKIAVPLMKEGAKWRLYVPYNLAYGARGRPPQIGPYQALIFNIELIKVNPDGKKQAKGKTDTKTKTDKKQPAK